MKTSSKEYVQEMCNNKSDSLTGIFLFVLLAIPLFIDTQEQYIVFFISFTFLFFTQKHWRLLYWGKTIDNVAIYFLLAWVWGVCVGLCRGNAMTDIFQNFAGMIIYTLFIFLKDRKINIDLMFKVIYMASVIASIEIIYAHYAYSHGNALFWPLTNIEYNTWGNSVDSSIKVLPFVLLSLSLWNVLHPKGKISLIKNLLLYILSTMSIVFTTDSGGSLLGYIAIFGTIIFISPTSNRKSVKYYVFSIIIFLIVIICFLYYESQTGLLYSIFSENTSGNDKRLYQFSMVFDRLKILGNGLGSRFRYVYLKRIRNSYGIEVSYLNLIDKFGIVALPMLWYFTYSYIKPTIMLMKNKGSNKLNACIIGMMGYTFVAAGNPVIFAPYNVLLHVLSLLFLRYETKSF